MMGEKRSKRKDDSSAASELREPTRAAGVVVYRRAPGGPEALLLRARAGGHWTPPKGHLEPGEKPLAAALREFEEETGIEAQALELDPQFTERLEYEVVRDGETYPKEVTYFLGRLEPSRTPRLSAEHDAYAWWDRERLEREETFEDMRALLRNALRRAEQRAER